jgi:cohesin loading factor subunit SCC2
MRFLFFGSLPVLINSFDRSPEEVARIDRLAEEIGIVQDLRNSYQPILNVTLLALDAPPVFVRTKALRALGQIVTSDPTILTSVRPFLF